VFQAACHWLGGGVPSSMPLADHACRRSRLHACLVGSQTDSVGISKIDRRQTDAANFCSLRANSSHRREAASSPDPRCTNAVKAVTLTVLMLHAVNWAGSVSWMAVFGWRERQDKGRGHDL
jgi:hypothetical protein